MSKVFFDIKFASVGGSDQLFFSKLNKKRFIIRWNENLLLLKTLMPKEKKGHGFLKEI